MIQKIAIQRCKYVTADYLMTVVAFTAFNVLRYHLLDMREYQNALFYILTPKMIAEDLAVPVMMVGVYWLSGYYNKPFLKSRLQELFTTLFSALINTALTFLLLLTNDMGAMQSTNYTLLLELFALLFAFTYLGRLLLTSASTRRIKRHSLAFSTLIIGNSCQAREKGAELSNSKEASGYSIRGYVDIPGEESSGMPAYAFDEIEKIVNKERISQIIISPATLNESLILSLLNRLFSLPVSIKIAPATFSYLTYGIRLSDIYGEPFVELTSPNVSESSKNLKRVFDVIISACALIILSPLYLGVALCVKLSSPGPVIYSQERIGYRRKPFRIYKFRTMRTDAESDGPQLASDSDPRVTRIGSTLRKFRLDELPQFWNVLKGDMSVVGPRPERDFFISKIVAEAPYYTLLHQVRPGITSWGMVKFGYASSIPQMVSRAQYDLVYLQNMSLSVDLKIIIHTVKTVVTGKGK